MRYGPDGTPQTPRVCPKSSSLFGMSIIDATDPDLTRLLINNDGKLIVYHGWADFSGNRTL